jgi:hypothetical protein
LRTRCPAIAERPLRALKSGTLHLAYASTSRPLDASRIDRDRWQRDKRLVIERAARAACVDPRPVLAAIEEALSPHTGPRTPTSSRGSLRIAKSSNGG